MNFLVTFESGINKGRSFLVEDVANEADAINRAFDLAGENCTCSRDSRGCPFVQVAVRLVPVNKNQPKSVKVHG